MIFHLKKFISKNITRTTSLHRHTHLPSTHSLPIISNKGLWGFLIKLLGMHDPSSPDQDSRSNWSLSPLQGKQSPQVLTSGLPGNSPNKASFLLASGRFLSERNVSGLERSGIFPKDTHLSP